jgi:hypothetical protein
MSDTYYRERAAQRTRRFTIIGGIIAVFACAAFSVFSVFRDTCTGGFDRSPDAVVRNFVEGVRSGEVDTLTSCWQHQAYYDLESGCSEICLGRILGTQYQLVEVQFGDQLTADEGRARIAAQVTVTCPGGEGPYTGDVTLDSVASNVPWRHWKIVHSTFGGPLSDPWCQ